MSFLKLKLVCSRLLVFVNRPGTRFLIALVLMGVILLMLDQKKIWENLRQVNFLIALLMLAVNVLLLLLFAGRWRSIILKLDFRVPFSKSLRAIWLSAFFGQFGPTLVLAELTRFQSVHAYAKASRIITSQLVDRVSGQLVLMLIVLVLSPFYYLANDIPGSPQMAAIIAVLAIAGLAGGLYFNRYPNRFTAQVNSGFAALNPLMSPGHYGYSLVIQVLLVLNFTMAAIGLGVLKEPLAFVMSVPLVLAGITLLPISVSDWGTREAAAIVIFSHTGLDAERIAAVSILFGAMNLLSALPGGFFLMAAKSRAGDSPVAIVRNPK